MATKNTKKTLRTQYMESLKTNNLNNYLILCFKFPDMAKANSFHFDLLAKHVPYLLYDGATESVKVILHRGEEEIKEEITNIAIYHDGEKIPAKID